MGLLLFMSIIFNVMIIIRTFLPSQPIILTLDGLDYVPALNITHDETRISFIVELPSPTLQNDRYSYFTVPTGSFDGQPTGYYSYSIKDVNGAIIEQGKLLNDNGVSDVVIIAPPVENPILVYNG